MTAWNATARATSTAAPVGAVGSVERHPTPEPAANASTTTPARASTFAAVARFCAQRPDATPARFTPVNRAAMPAPTQRVWLAPRPASRPVYSPATTAIAAGMAALFTG